MYALVLSSVMFASVDCPECEQFKRRAAMRSLWQSRPQAELVQPESDYAPSVDGSSAPQFVPIIPFHPVRRAIRFVFRPWLK